MYIVSILNLDGLAKFKKLINYLKTFRKKYHLSFLTSKEIEVILYFKPNMDLLVIVLKELSRCFAVKKFVFQEDFLKKKISSKENKKSRQLIIESFNLFNISASINEYYRSTRPNEKENKLKKSLINLIKELVKKIFLKERVRIILFGSTISGLDRIGSDIDVAIQIEKQNGTRHTDIKERWYLKKLVFPLKKHTWFDLESRKIHKFKVKPILKAKVPIISIKDPFNTIKLDVSLYRDQIHLGEWINQICKLDGRIRIFLCAIKFWSKQRRINDGKNGFLNSFGFVLLGVKFLQIVKPPVLPFSDKFYKSWNKMNVSSLLFLFFTFYHQFNFQAKEISVRTEDILKKRANYWLQFLRTDQCNLIIEDPIELSHNVARNLREKMIKLMKGEFKRAKTCIYLSSWEELVQKK